MHLSKVVMEDQMKAICNTMVESLVGEENSDVWWDTPNVEFNNRTPNEQWKCGSDAVVYFLMEPK